MAYNIKYGTSSQYAFSEQQLISCATQCFKCNGGHPYYASTYVKSLNTSTASQYTGLGLRANVHDTWVNGTCPSTVATPYYWINKVGIAQNTDETTMLNALIQYGPMAVGMYASEKNFQLYSSHPTSDNIYTSDSCPTTPDHAVLLVGFGETANKKYWILKNSWGTDWGLNGYFYLERGVNLCGITSFFVWVQV